jgi:DUF1365 family protein
MESCLYEGWVRHRRHAPVAHAFRFPLAMLYLDLDELDDVFRGRWCWSTRRPALGWFRRADHVGDPRVPLGDSVRTLIARDTGRWLDGPIRLLTHPRYAGYVFNPLSLYYCFARDGREIEAIVADVTSTPWGERHQYVLGAAAGEGADGGGARRWRHAKAMHVSPFLPMALDYCWHVGRPGARLGVHLSARPASPEAAGPVFDATLALRRRALDGVALAGVLLRRPAQTVQVAAAIYWQALRLWLRGAPFYAHPARTAGGAR